MKRALIIFWVIVIIGIVFVLPPTMEKLDKSKLDEETVSLEEITEGKSVSVAAIMVEEMKDYYHWEIRKSDGTFTKISGLNNFRSADLKDQYDYSGVVEGNGRLYKLTGEARKDFSGELRFYPAKIASFGTARDVRWYSFGIAGVLVIALVIFALLDKKDEKWKAKKKRITKTKLIVSESNLSRTTGTGVYVGMGVSVGHSNTYHQVNHTYRVYYRDGHTEIETVVSGTEKDKFYMSMLEE